MSLLVMMASCVRVATAQAQEAYPTFMPIPAWHAQYHDGEVFPDCDCKCCTAEFCPCQAGDTGCSDEVLCFTDKGPHCEQWIGQNIEVTYCNIQKLWKQWRNINPHDPRFMTSRDRMKHDIFCRDFCAPEIDLPGAGCAQVGLPTPKPTINPCPDHCTCDDEPFHILLQKGRSFRSRKQNSIKANSTKSKGPDHCTCCNS